MDEQEALKTVISAAREGILKAAVDDGSSILSASEIDPHDILPTFTVLLKDGHEIAIGVFSNN